MASCEICGEEMLNRVGCKVGICDCNGKSYPRIRFGTEKRFEGVFGDDDCCPDCLAPLRVFTILAVILKSVRYVGRQSTVIANAIWFFPI